MVIGYTPIFCTDKEEIVPGLKRSWKAPVLTYSYHNTESIKCHKTHILPTLDRLINLYSGICAYTYTYMKSIIIIIKITSLKNSREGCMGGFGGRKEKGGML